MNYLFCFNEQMQQMSLRLPIKLLKSTNYKVIFY